MEKNLKKRIYTSIFLFIALFSMLINNLILGYFLIILGVLSILEFSKINSLIFPKKKIKKILINIFFITYILIFCSAFLFFSNFLHLKILIFIVLFTCVASDIGGFIFGKIFKGPKLTKISPNKTYTGSLGSLIFSSLLLSISVFYLTKNFELNIVIIGCITSLGCQIGDLFFSYLKRKSSLKDTGNFLPGHGGILDRVDGILVGMPVGFLALLLIY